VPFDESHVNDDLLALLALGEPVGSASDLAHIEECERCADEVDALRGVVGLAREAGSGHVLVAPAPHVWQRISAELELAAADTPTLATVPDEVPAPVTDLSARRGRSRSWRLVAAAAAVGVLIGGTGVWWRTTQSDPATTVLATATLEPLPGRDATGSAVVETSADGSRVLVVDLDSGAASADGFREVWLATADLSGMISVGNLDGSSGRFALPAGLDLARYTVVDVSQEEFDGDPAHSADSIVRGALRA